MIRYYTVSFCWLEDILPEVRLLSCITLLTRGHPAGSEIAVVIKDQRIKDFWKGVFDQPINDCLLVFLDSLIFDRSKNQRFLEGSLSSTDQWFSARNLWFFDLWSIKDQRIKDFWKGVFHQPINDCLLELFDPLIFDRSKTTSHCSTLYYVILYYTVLYCIILKSEFCKGRIRTWNREHIYIYI